MFTEINCLGSPNRSESRVPLPARIIVPAHLLAKGVAEFLGRLIDSGTLPDGCFGLTEDGKRMFRGDVLFELKATHGFPLDFALDRIINDECMAVDWPAFIDAARKNKWWDFQIYETLCHAMVDAMLPRDMQDAIRTRFQRYVLAYPHPELVMPNAEGKPTPD
jgi:hypothetical protein